MCGALFYVFWCPIAQKQFMKIKQKPVQGASKVCVDLHTIFMGTEKVHVGSHTIFMGPKKCVWAHTPFLWAQKNCV